jgi:diguanylate cyclase (GGDEF)-like protein
LEGIADWRGRPAAVWTFALFGAVGSVLCLLGWVAAGTPGRSAPLAAAVTGAVLAVTFWVAGRRTPWWALDLGRVAAAVAITVLVSRAGTGEGALASALGFTWIALHAALFCPRPVARAHTVLGLVGSAVGLSLSVPGTSGTLAWIVLSCTSIVASETLAVLFARVRALSLVDPLTGLLNRTGFLASVQRELAAARRTAEPLVLVVIDLDGFKAVNDHHGHDAGDRLLVALADGWRSHLRPRDLAGRLGGDEFAVALPATTVTQTGALVERLRATAPIGFSVGVAATRSTEPLDETLHRADRRMYADKSDRRAARRSGLEPIEPPPVDQPRPPQAVVQPRSSPLPEFDRVRP